MNKKYDLFVTEKFVLLFLGEKLMANVLIGSGALSESIECALSWIGFDDQKIVSRNRGNAQLTPPLGRVWDNEPPVGPHRVLWHDEILTAPSQDDGPLIDIERQESELGLLLATSQAAAEKLRTRNTVAPR